MELTNFIIAGFGTFLLGVSKGGVKGLGIFVVTLFALVFGGKQSTGVIMPLLIAGDIFAVIYYNRHVQWRYIMKLMPAMILGVLIGVAVGKNLDEFIFKRLMACVIILSVGIMLWWERRKSEYIPQQAWFGWLMGGSAGFTTMIGNLAGAFSNIYFLVMRLPKNQFIGTAAWLFFIINLFKLPFHVFSWKTISTETLFIDVKLLVFLFLGLMCGIYFVGKINEKFFRIMILTLTAVGGIAIFFK